MIRKYCGYCLYHMNNLTPNNIRFKRCTSKMNGEELGDCKHLIRYNAHQMWTKRPKTIKRRGFSK